MGEIVAFLVLAGIVFGLFAGTLALLYWGLSW
jgi:hypothetical protein